MARYWYSVGSGWSFLLVMADPGDLATLFIVTLAGFKINMFSCLYANGQEGDSVILYMSQFQPGSSLSFGTDGLGTHFVLRKLDTSRCAAFFAKLIQVWGRITSGQWWSNLSGQDIFCDCTGKEWEHYRNTQILVIIIITTTRVLINWHYLSPVVKPIIHWTPKHWLHNDIPSSWEGVRDERWCHACLCAYFSGYYVCIVRFLSLCSRRLSELHAEWLWADQSSLQQSPVSPTLHTGQRLVRDTMAALIQETTQSTQWVLAVCHWALAQCQSTLTMPGFCW